MTMQDEPVKWQHVPVNTGGSRLPEHVLRFFKMYNRDIENNGDPTLQPYVLGVIKVLNEDGKLEAYVSRLTDKDYSKEHLRLTFPLLIREADYDPSEKKYYTKAGDRIKVNNSLFLVTNDWYRPTRSVPHQRHHLQYLFDWSNQLYG